MPRAPVTLERAVGWTEAQLQRAPRAELERLQREVATLLVADAKANALHYYRPISERARRVHLATAREVGLQGGNKAGKTATLLAELAIAMTGEVPASLQAAYPAGKWPAPPIRCRLVVTSLVNAWDINLKLKIQWWEWNGPLNADGLPGDPTKGHYGFISKRWLIHGEWAGSWSEKHRVLRLTNGSTLQVMSHDQALEDFNQGSFHLIVEDEIPPEEIHRANRLRTLEVGGRILVGGTPPDQETTGVAAGWYFDQILSPGLEAADPHGAIYAVPLWTEENSTLDPAALETIGRGLTPEQRRARFHGESLHLAGLVLPGFRERPAWWCLRCAAPTLAPASDLGPRCDACGSAQLLRYAHVVEDAEWPDGWPGPRDWPVLFYMDPHPSRPTACCWVKVDPLDQWWVAAELEVAGNAAEVRDAVYTLEAEAGWRPAWRTGDPKITAQANQYAREFEGRPFTIREAFEEVGFDFLNANTNFTVARERILQAFMPSPDTRAPRLRVSRRCPRMIHQVTHYVWEPRNRESQSIKEVPGRKHSDFPALLRYLAMEDPTYRGCQLAQVPVPLHIGGHGKGRNSATGW